MSSIEHTLEMVATLSNVTIGLDLASLVNNLRNNTHAMGVGMRNALKIKSFTICFSVVIAGSSSLPLFELSSISVDLKMVSHHIRV